MPDETPVDKALRLLVDAFDRVMGAPVPTTRLAPSVTPAQLDEARRANAIGGARVTNRDIDLSPGVGGATRMGPPPQQSFGQQVLDLIQDPTKHLRPALNEQMGYGPDETGPASLLALLSQDFSDPGSVTPAGHAAQAAAPLLSIEGLPGKAGELSEPLANLIKRVKGYYTMRAPVLHRYEAALRAGADLPAEWSKADVIYPAIGAHTVGGTSYSAPEMTEKYLRSWGAQSPQRMVIGNTDDALYALAQYLQGGPITEEFLRSLPGAYNIPSKAPNVMRAWAGEPLQSGGHIGKSEAMTQLLLGHDRLPLDTHAMGASGANQSKFDEHISGLRQLFTEAEGLPYRGGLTDTDIYNRSEEAMRNGLIEVLGGDYSKRAFPQLWEGVRALKGYPFTGGPLDLKRAWGLLEPGAMGSAENILRVLRTPLAERGAGTLSAREYEELLRSAKIKLP